jgi:hypothetical protein
MQKLLVILAIVVMHLLVVYYCLSDSYSKKSPTTEKVILLNLFHDRTEVSWFVEVGDGDCMTSMPKVANGERGTRWSSSRVKCGKSESERMMESVERNLKHKN